MFPVFKDFKAMVEAVRKGTAASKSGLAAIAGGNHNGALPWGVGEATWTTIPSQGGIIHVAAGRSPEQTLHQAGCDTCDQSTEAT